MFVVICAPDGAGKGTHVEILGKRLMKHFPEREVETTWEPWEEEPYGRRIRRILRHEETEVDPGDGKVFADKLQLLYVRNRGVHHQLVVYPVLRNEGIVVSDRERMSTYAYGYAFGVSLERIHTWHEVPELATPDLVIYLRTAPKTCMARMGKRPGEAEFFERADKIARICAAYEHVIESGLIPNVVVVDNEGTIKEVADAIWALVEPLAATLQEGR